MRKNFRTKKGHPLQRMPGSITVSFAIKSLKTV
nr:MAG TPA: hypothetical protein [Caudoviricetes sp.]